MVHNILFLADRTIIPRILSLIYMIDQPIDFPFFMLERPKVSIISFRTDLVKERDSAILKPLYLKSLLGQIAKESGKGVDRGKGNTEIQMFHDHFFYENLGNFK